MMYWCWAEIKVSLLMNCMMLSDYEQPLFIIAMTTWLSV